jgi:SNF2 family DNA or RNA helicase
MIASAFPGKCVRHTGAESPQEKERSIRRFVTDPTVQLFLGNIKSTGFGVDGLQEICDTAVFVEMSYVPEEIKQCIDRLNRMGQKSPVQVQFLIAENSVDEKVLGTLTEKASNINIIMGGGGAGREAEFVATRCGSCGKITEMTKLKRIMKISVCPECRKNMECLL